MAATQQRQRPQPSRLAPLQEASSTTPTPKGSNHPQQWQQTSRNFSQGGSLFGGQCRADSFNRNSSGVSNSPSFSMRSPGQKPCTLLTQNSMDMKNSSMRDKGQNMLWQNSIGSTGSPSTASTPCAEGAGGSAGITVSRSGAAGRNNSSMQRSAGQQNTPRSRCQGGKAAAEECVM